MVNKDKGYHRKRYGYIKISRYRKQISQINSFLKFKIVTKSESKKFFKKLLTTKKRCSIMENVGVDDVEGTPVSISNTVVKLDGAENT